MGDQKLIEAKMASEAPDLNLKTETAKRQSKKFALACTMLASMTSILLGYDIGVMSGASIFIKQDLNISDTQVEILLGVLNLYSLVGSYAAGFTSDWIGRRYTIVFAGSIFFCGAILMGFATNYAFLMVGRFVAGIGVGYALMIAPVYTAEVAPTSHRGFLTSFPEVFINSGILLGYVSNFGFGYLRQSRGSLAWRLMLGAGAIPSVFLAIGVLAMPESPRWLVMQGRLGDARKVLENTSDTPEETEVRLQEIKKAAGIPEECTDDVVTPPERSHGEGVWKEMFIRPAPSVRRVLITAIGIHFFQQASGIDSVVLYSPRVFMKAGIQNETKLLATTVAVGFTKTVFILVATFLVERVGRRPLLLSSVGGMILSLAGLGIGLKVIEHHPTQQIYGAIGLCIASILGYVAFFSIGLGPITWVYTSEILPLRIRAQGAGIGVAVNRVTSGVVTMTFISLYNAITIGGSFFLYGGIAVVAWILFFICLPETGGRSLEDIEELFGKKREEEKMKSSSEVQMVNGSGKEGESTNPKT